MIDIFPDVAEKGLEQGATKKTDPQNES